MNYYNIAADFKESTIDGYARLNKDYADSKVLETYGQVTIGNSFEGGRVHVDIPKIGLYDLKQYVEYSAAQGIGFNYSLNGSCMGNKEFSADGVASLISYLRELHSIGIRSLTVALPSVIEVIKSLDLNFEIKTSIISQVNTANKALQYKKIGVDRIVTDEAINRNFTRLREISNVFGNKIEVIVNSMCHQDCIYRLYHYNQTSHDSVAKDTSSINTYYNHKCMLKRAENVEEWIKLCWIRPEDIPYYNQVGIHYFKIQGRHTVYGGNPIKAIECYFSQSYTGDLVDLFELFNCPYSFKVSIDNKKLNGFIKKFFEDSFSCNKNCEQCGYCKSYAIKSTDYQGMQQTNDMARDFYHEFDQYSQMLNEQREVKRTVRTAVQMTEFDF